MNIRDWPIDRIMQLPDFCFGRRFFISCSVQAARDIVAWDISEIALPNACVLWGLIAYQGDTAPACYLWRLALGNQLPTTTAMMDGLEPLIPGLGIQGAEPREILAGVDLLIEFPQLRMPINTMGRRMVLEVEPASGSAADFAVVAAVSSIPKEVPDWLLSGRV